MSSSERELDPNEDARECGSEPLPMSSGGSKSGRACLRNCDAPGRLNPEANEDLLEVRAWYDNIRQELGERFALAVED
jgi:hypothetical protein